VRRARGSIAAAGGRVARDLALMTDDAVDLSPSPSPQRCPTCPFLAPCTAMEAGRDPEFIVLKDYRRRGEEELEDAGLRRSDERSEQLGAGFGQEGHANFRWS